MTDENSPGWLRDRRQREVSNAQLIRGQISTLDDDTLFWVDFDSSGMRAFNRILCRKVGDAASYRVQLSWMSTHGHGDLSWRDAEAPYPPSNCNPTMRMTPMDGTEQAACAMLIAHEQYDALRHYCNDAHNRALLSRARAEREAGYLIDPGQHSLT